MFNTAIWTKQRIDWIHATLHLLFKAPKKSISQPATVNRFYASFEKKGDKNRHQSKPGKSNESFHCKGGKWYQLHKHFSWFVLAPLVNIRAEACNPAHPPAERLLVDGRAIHQILCPVEREKDRKLIRNQMQSPTTNTKNFGWKRWNVHSLKKQKLAWKVKHAQLPILPASARVFSARCKIPVVQVPPETKFGIVKSKPIYLHFFSYALNAAKTVSVIETCMTVWISNTKHISISTREPEWAVENTTRSLHKPTQIQKHKTYKVQLFFWSHAAPIVTIVAVEGDTVRYTRAIDGAPCQKCQMQALSKKSSF